MTAARFTPGAICLSSSSHFPPMPYSKLVNPVTLPPGRARLLTKPAPTGSGTCANTIGTVRVACSNGVAAPLPAARMTSGASATNSAAYLRVSVGTACGPAILDPQVAPDGPARLLQPLQERCVAGLCDRSVCRECHEGADAPHTLALLRARALTAMPPRAASPAMNSRRLHSMTSSAVPTRVGDNSSPSALAVLRLTTKRNFVGRCTGKSPGFSPLRMRST